MQNFSSEKPIRIQKVISRAGIASRRAAEKMIFHGLVMLNGEIVKKMGQKMIIGKDHLSIEGKQVNISKQQKILVYALYKPKNCITTLSDPKGRTTISEFFPKTVERLFPIGRLDYDTEGLILVTNNGDLAQKLMHPSYKVSKGYFVKVRGLVNSKTLAILKSGHVIEKLKFQPIRAKILHTINDKTWLEIFLKEGKNRQIKKILLSLGYPVQKIKRFKVGPVSLGNLKSGEFRILSSNELKLL